MEFQIKVFWIFNCYLERLSLKLLYFIKSTKYLILFLGLVFWSTSTRKFFTIPEAKSIKLSKNSDDISSTSRKSHRPSRYNFNESQGQFAEEITETQAEIRKSRELVFKHHPSASFVSPFEITFQCCIWKQTPADLATVCSTLVGCKACTDELYRNSLDKRCPKCRAARSLSKTFDLKEFDDLVSQIKIISDQDDAYWQLSDWLKAERANFHLKNFNFFFR